MATTNNHAAERGSLDLAREEFMLKIQASILERCLRKEVQENQTVEERCRALRQKIIFMEDELSRAGKANTARRCLEDSSRSEFDAVNHVEFLKWLASSSRSASNTPQQEHAELPASSRKRGHDSKDGFHTFSVALPGHSSGGNTSRIKRVRYVSKETPPCLRCRVLKKKCDASDPCSLCPVQGYDSENDFWKVLGCFRGHLQDMVDIFCPDFSRATTRTLKHSIGDINTINFVLTKSRVSGQKRGRIVNLINTRSDFRFLADVAWDDVTFRESISRSALSLDQCHDEQVLNGIEIQDYESAWAVLQLVSMDRIYLGKTAYNLFGLIRLGNCYSKNDPTRWDIFFQAKRIMRQSVELYLLGGLCVQIASGTMAGPIPFDSTQAMPNTLIMIDLKEDMESFLLNFDKVCGGRAKLIGRSQLAAFFSLLVFGIAKSILTDTYALRDDSEKSSPWNIGQALKISSAYKGLVSVFCWASKTDVMLFGDEDPAAPVSLDLRREIRHIVRFDQWSVLGFKGMKDFLLSLGSCFLPDGTFNGFLIQKFGIETISKITALAEGEIRPRSGEPIRIGGIPVFDIGQGLTHSNPELRNYSGVGNHSVNTTQAHEVTPTRPMFTTHVTPVHKTTVAYSSNTTSTRPLGSYPSIMFVTHPSDEDQVIRRGHGGRRGALDSDTLEKAREVRKLGACWNCWAMKVPCSEGSKCERCHKKADSPEYSFCNRGTFSSIFTSTLFPDFLFSHYRLENVHAFTNSSVSAWGRHSIYAQVTWEPGLKMNLPVNTFIPRSEQNHFRGQNGELLGAQPLLLALLPDSLETAAEKYSKEMEILVDGSSSTPFSASYQCSDLVRIVLEVLHRFQKQDQAMPLIHSCLLLYISLCFGPQPSVFPASTAQSGEVRQLMTVSAQVYTSRLLSRQSKGIFYNIATKYAQEVLTLLEKFIRSRERSTWPVCFAAMLLLCVCIERLQMVSVAQTVFDIDSQREKSGDEPYKSCKAMDDLAFGQLVHIFHTLYRTHKVDQGGFNPFVSAQETTSESGFNEAAKTMIREMKEKSFGNGCALLLRHNHPLQTTSNPKDFVTENSGRLVAKFLLSFNPLWASSV